MIQEFDSARFQDPLHSLNILRPPGDGTGAGGLHAANCVDVYTGHLGYVLLLDPYQSPSGFQLIASGQHLSL
ncbi:hypothetical protein [Mesorhizobium sp.]|uniref:hypothetical protein n=1 Tax=Mesorhizobium sp. TaxID=1871066 RepID=UPI00344BA676